MLYLLGYDSFGQFTGFYSYYSSNAPRQSVRVDESLHRYLVSGDYKFKIPPYDVKKTLTLDDVHLFMVRKSVCDQTEPLDSTDLVKEQLLQSVEQTKEEVNKDLKTLNECVQRESLINSIQSNDITVTQDALDFLLFQTFRDILEVSGNSKATRKEGDTMSAYFVSRILKKGAISVEQGRSYYLQVKTQYPQLIEEIDFLLISEGREDLIVK